LAGAGHRSCQGFRESSLMRIGKPDDIRGRGGPWLHRSAVTRLLILDPLRPAIERAGQAWACRRENKRGSRCGTGNLSEWLPAGLRLVIPAICSPSISVGWLLTLALDDNSRVFANTPYVLPWRFVGRRGWTLRQGCFGGCFKGFRHHRCIHHSRKRYNASSRRGPIRSQAWIRKNHGLRKPPKEGEARGEDHSKAGKIGQDGTNLFINFRMWERRHVRLNPDGRG
jgi:hypothetical protein